MEYNIICVIPCGMIGLIINAVNSEINEDSDFSLMEQLYDNKILYWSQRWKRKRLWTGERESLEEVSGIFHPEYNVPYS